MNLLIWICVRSFICQIIDYYQIFCTLTALLMFVPVIMYVTLLLYTFIWCLFSVHSFKNLASQQILNANYNTTKM